MRNIRGFIALPALVIGAACAKNDSPKMDDALRTDLTTAQQAQPYNPQQTVSPMEQGYQPAGAQQAYVGNGQGYVAPAPAPAPVRTRTVYRDRPVYRSSSSGGSSGGSSSGTYHAPTEKHGGRDAAIGAVAGAVIGATTSRDKVKGGVIGGAAGGILGAVIGNNVDIKKH